MPTTVINSENARYDIAGGNNTTDKIFLLSIDEAKKYFISDKERVATLADGTDVRWWLRGPGVKWDYAIDVYSNGEVDEPGGTLVYDGKSIAVRPAMWIDISDL